MQIAIFLIGLIIGAGVVLIFTTVLSAQWKDTTLSIQNDWRDLFVKAQSDWQSSISKWMELANQFQQKYLDSVKENGFLKFDHQREMCAVFERIALKENASNRTENN